MLTRWRAPRPHAARPDGAPAVLLRGVSRLFDGVPALALVDLEVARGEAVLVHGPNGAGKTTLLRVLATALSPTYGRGRVLGYDLRSERRQIRAGVELVGHATRLYEDLSPREHLRFVRRLHRADGDVDAALTGLGLEPVADVRIRRLSQGLRRRVALARAWLRRPQLLLLDEPAASIDEGARRSLGALLARARADGAAVVLATHDVERAREVVDRSIEMAEGRIVRDSR